MRWFAILVAFVALLLPLPAAAQTYTQPTNVMVFRSVQNLNALPGEVSAFTFTAMLNEDGEENFDRYALAFMQVETQMFGQPMLNMQTLSPLVPEDFGYQRSAFSGQISADGLLINVAVMFVFRGTTFYTWTAMGYEADPFGALLEIGNQYTFRTNIGENPTEARVKKFVPADDILPPGFTETAFTVTDAGAA